MAYFWVLKNGSDRGGVTVHWIDEGIDTGDVLARRSFPLKANTTQKTVLMLTAVIGAKLIERLVRKLVSGEQLTPLTIGQEKDMYYPMPGEKDFEGYFEQRRFFRIRDILGLLVMKKH